MIRSSLLSLLMLTGICATAKDVTLTNYKLPSYYQGAATDVDHVCFIINYGGEYGMTNKTANSVSMNGKGLGWFVDMGAAVPVRIGNRTGDNTFIQVSLQYHELHIKERYKDIVGADKDQKYIYQYVSVPISFNSLYNSNSNIGFYWRAGVNISYLYDAKKANVDGSVKGDFSSINIAPFAGLGIAFDSDIRRGLWAGQKVKNFIGPFISYGVNNMSGVNGTSMHPLVIGIQLTAVKLGA